MNLLSKRIETHRQTIDPQMNPILSKVDADWRKNQPLKLHLGCGKRVLDGWYNIDAVHFPNVHLVCDVHDMSQFDDGVADEIYACHILEHINRHKVHSVLKEWIRVLKPGGILRIAVPNFEAIVEHYQEHRDLSVLMGLLYGGQDSELNYHYVAFDFHLMNQVLSDLGLVDVKLYDHKQFLPQGYDDFSKCYLPHMDDNSGKLMSLNIIATKPY